MPKPTSFVVKLRNKKQQGPIIRKRELLRNSDITNSLDSKLDEILFALKISFCYGLHLDSTVIQFNISSIR